MRILIEFDLPDSEAFFPYNYPEYVQAMIYRCLPEKEAQQLHDRGFLYQKRSFKLFTFSRLLGKLNRGFRGPGLQFRSPVSLQIASPVDWILQEVAEHLIRIGKVNLGRNALIVKSVAVLTKPDFGKQMKIRMLSPMTIYSTLSKPDGKKLTHYYTPHDREFSELMTRNLQKKLELIYRTGNTGEIRITSTSPRNRERIVKYKGFVIKAWDGKYLLEGDPELIEVAYETGLGSKNSQGFGMWEALPENAVN